MSTANWMSYYTLKNGMRILFCPTLGLLLCAVCLFVYTQTCRILNCTFQMLLLYQTIQSECLLHSNHDTPSLPFSKVKLYRQCFLGTRNVSLFRHQPASLNNLTSDQYRTQCMAITKDHFFLIQLVSRLIDKIIWIFTQSSDIVQSIICC